MLLLEKLSKAHNRTQWRTNLVAHITQEGILHRLNLLSLGRLLSQFLFSGLDFTDVTADAKVLNNASLLVFGGDK